MYTGTNIRVDGTKADFAFGMNLYGQDFAFVPESVLNKGFISGEKQYYLPAVLEPSFQEKIAPYSKTFSIDNVSEFGGKEFVKQYEKSGFADTQGYLIPQSLASELAQKVNSYDVNEKTDEGFVFGPITGVGVNEAGTRYYNVAASGMPNASAWIGPGDEGTKGQWYDPGKKWYETTLGKVGIVLAAASGLGFAGIGPLAGGSAAASGGAAGGATAGGAAGGTAAAGGIVGTPGVSTIFPVAAPVAPAVTSIAPIATAGGAALGAFTPAPGSLQAALPGMGVETAASAGGFTAAPGSFQAALPGLGIASAPSLAGNLATSSGISATDALRLANQARGLLGAGQNPIVPQQQGLPQGGGQAQGVDYSGLLSLLQLQAKTPGVSSLTQPAQLRQMYQTTLLPNVLSLLG